MAKSALNRHHRQRMLQRWQQQHPKSTSESRAINDAEWREGAMRRYVKTRTPCSCPMCRSSRKLYGNGRAALTFQELRHPIEFE